eukprot:SAG31_NODE_1503_length_8079_cov_5.930827_5_plen_98_part_00
MPVATGVQAYTARRAERSLAEQAQEQHAWELARQREQEMTVAQIARTERWVDEFCSPVFRLLTDYNQGRVRFGECDCTCALPVCSMRQSRVCVKRVD